MVLTWATNHPTFRPMLDRSRKHRRKLIRFAINTKREGHEPDLGTKEKNPAAVALGRLGGLKGGKARAEKLSRTRRAEIASLAARARWKNDR